MPARFCRLRSTAKCPEPEQGKHSCEPASFTWLHVAPVSSLSVQMALRGKADPGKSETLQTLNPGSSKRLRVHHRLRTLDPTSKPGIWVSH